jgi:hypothetical protein
VVEGGELRQREVALSRHGHVGQRLGNLEVYVHRPSVSVKVEAATRGRLKVEPIAHGDGRVGDSRDGRARDDERERLCEAERRGGRIGARVFAAQRQPVVEPRLLKRRTLRRRAQREVRARAPQQRTLDAAERVAAPADVRHHEPRPRPFEPLVAEQTEREPLAEDDGRVAREQRRARGLGRRRLNVAEGDRFDIEAVQLAQRVGRRSGGLARAGVALDEGEGEAARSLPGTGEVARRGEAREHLRAAADAPRGLKQRDVLLIVRVLVEVVGRVVAAGVLVVQVVEVLVVAVRDGRAAEQVRAVEPGVVLAAPAAEPLAHPARAREEFALHEHRAAARALSRVVGVDDVAVAQPPAPRREDFGRVLAREVAHRSPRHEAVEATAVHLGERLREKVFGEQQVVVEPEQHAASGGERDARVHRARLVEDAVAADEGVGVREAARDPERVRRVVHLDDRDVEHTRDLAQTCKRLRQVRQTLAPAVRDDDAHALFRARARLDESQRRVGGRVSYYVHRRLSRRLCCRLSRRRLCCVLRFVRGRPWAGPVPGAMGRLRPSGVP